FTTAITTLHNHAVTTYLEIGPDTTLTPHIHTPATVTTATLHHNQPENHTLTTAIATLHTHGTPINWTTYHQNHHPTPPHELPTYPFQHHRYWLNTPKPTTNTTTLGLTPTTHPLLPATLELPDDSVLFTGHISLNEHPWLAEHVIVGTPLLPATAMVELLVWAGERSGCGLLEDLMLAIPLVLPEVGGAQVQVHVGPPDTDGRRAVQLRSRAAASARTSDPGGEAVGGHPEWTTHATGTVAPASTRPPVPVDGSGTGLPAQWPPSGTQPVELNDAYGRLRDAGYGYGPLFQGLRAAWQGPGELYAELALPAGLRESARPFALHPALFDAALHVLALDHLAGPAAGDAAEPVLRLPYAWSRVRLHGTASSLLRVRLSTASAGDGTDTARLVITDESGALVAEAEELIVRSTSRAQLAALLDDHVALFEGRHRSLFEPVRSPLPPRPVVPSSEDGPWAVVGPSDSARLCGDLFDSTEQLKQYDDVAALSAAVAAGDAVPEAVLLPVLSNADCEPHSPEAAHKAVQRVHGTLRDWLAADVLDGVRLVVLTRKAVVTAPGEAVDDLAAAPVWGLVRTAQTEHPDRFVLVDVDGSGDARSLGAAIGTGESQLVLRDGLVSVPELARVPAAPSALDVAADVRSFDPEGTVLITGATGALGTLFAHHLVTQHGVRHLLLTSRRGPHAPGADQLHTQLTNLGATVHLAACDTADHNALANLLTTIPHEHPLTAVIHTAGTLADATLTTLTPQHLTDVLRPKIDAAWNLHHLTTHLPLTHFILFSSIAGALGSAGQANYAAANTYLDALAQHRRTLGLPATSLVWGLWGQSGMGAALEGAELARMRRIGVVAMEPEEGLSLFDHAVRNARPVLVPARFDTTALVSSPVPVPGVLRGLVRAADGGAAGGASPGGAASGDRRAHADTGAEDVERLLARLTGLPSEERREVLLDLVRETTAAVLGHAAPEAIAEDRGLLDLGLDSLTAVELRNRLNARTGLRLPTTLTFDYPTPGVLAGHLHDELTPRVAEAGGQDDGIFAHLTRIEASLPTLERDAESRTAAVDRLRAVLHRLGGAEGTPHSAAQAASAAAPGGDALGAATDDEIFQLIDELGTN
ncbi:SDR family NAD(P)-dependent oxidoreductase, partial [Streptomyces sp. NPDC007983]|uniref:SDR family NAD(P)-dependent oxidoreductase n=1 Tax=Streptomyces sp. NPDC007983 TaxID=3364800 RepID=UPI0036E9E11F